MEAERGGSFKPQDVVLLLKNISGSIEAKPAAERERLIQKGVHYSEMLPLESPPSPEYLAAYYRALESFSLRTATAIIETAEKIYALKGGGVVLVSLARAGTPVGVLVKRYLHRRFALNVPHYTISVVRGRGLDKAAMAYILARHASRDIQFIDGWTGKGAILAELKSASAEFVGKQNERRLLAVIADPANITDICGTHEDFPLASSFLNATVCGLMSRTIIHPGVARGEFHGAVFYPEMRAEDRTYEFIDKIEGCFAAAQIKGVDEVERIAAQYGISDINLIKPGVGETIRVLLRRLPALILIAENAEAEYVAHIIQLAKEKKVPFIRYPLSRYKACGIIKELEPDV